MKIIINEKQQDKLIKEYLDKEYMKPLYDYLKNGQRYSQNGSYSPSERLIRPFFEWACNSLNNEEWYSFKKALNNCSQLKEKIKAVNGNDGRHIIRCFSMISGKLELAPTNQFLKQNSKRIFTITYNDPQLSLFWDKFYFYINGEEGKLQLKKGQYLDADTVLMNPEIKKPMWLIHFTTSVKSALDICKNGFKKGLSTNQMSRLGYTNKDIDINDKQGKYCYAYNAQEIVEGFFPTDLILPKEKWGNVDNEFDQKVWENTMHNAVMFIASGIEVRHNTDNQQQVIFNSDNARNFVLLSFEKKQRSEKDPNNYKSFDKEYKEVLSWNVKTLNGDSLYDNPSLKKVIGWVINNYDQYRKPINQPKIDKIQDIDGYTKEEMIEWLNQHNTSKTKELIDKVNYAFETGEINREVKALVNSMYHEDMKRMNDKRNGYNTVTENIKENKEILQEDVLATATSPHIEILRRLGWREDDLKIKSNKNTRGLDKKDAYANSRYIYKTLHKVKFKLNDIDVYSYGSIRVANHPCRAENIIEALTKSPNARWMISFAVGTDKPSMSVIQFPKDFYIIEFNVSVRETTSSKRERIIAKTTTFIKNIMANGHALGCDTLEWYKVNFISTNQENNSLLNLLKDNKITNVTDLPQIVKKCKVVVPKTKKPTEKKHRLPKDLNVNFLFDLAMNDNSDEIEPDTIYQFFVPTEKYGNVLTQFNVNTQEYRFKDFNGKWSEKCMALSESKHIKKINISPKQEEILINENIKIHKGENGRKYSTQGKWEENIECPHCGEKAYFSMSISDGERGRGRIKVTDELGKEKDSEVQTIALYYCPKCYKFIARNNMA